MKKSFQVPIHAMPNFVYVTVTERLDKDAPYGFTRHSLIDIADFTQQEAEEFADLMRQSFMNHYASRKKQKESLKDMTGI